MTDFDEPVVDAEVLTEEKSVPGPRPALTIVIQSWATPVVGIVMLILGALGGFYARPLVLREAALPTQQVASEQPAASSSAQNPNAAEIMQVVTEQTRHFIGSEDAPVTIIEFGDFQ